MSDPVNRQIIINLESEKIIMITYCLKYFLTFHSFFSGKTILKIIWQYDIWYQNHIEIPLRQARQNVFRSSATILCRTTRMSRILVGTRPFDGVGRLCWKLRKIWWSMTVKKLLCWKVRKWVKVKTFLLLCGWFI